MNRFLLLLCCCVAVTSLCGCGPLTAPMPVRLDPESQKSIDESWEKALTPVDRLAHQPLLDALLASQAYQVGVDKLTFRSEKKVKAGTVVMEIAFDRARPDADRFEVTVYDPAGKLLRKESYDRKEVERTYDDLYRRHEELRRKVDGGKATPEEVKRLAELKARWDAVNALFPRRQQERPQPKAEAPARRASA
jgi:hypothetical protein